MAESSTSDAAYIVADLGKKLALASRVVVQKAKADADLRTSQPREKLDLAERLKRAEGEIQILTKLSSSLKEENKLLKDKCSKLEAAAADDEKVLDNIRKTVEEDTNEKAALKGRIAVLEQVQTKVVELEKHFGEVLAGPKVCIKSTRRLSLYLEPNLCLCRSRLKVPMGYYAFWTG